jgi:hypothetical protein
MFTKNRTWESSLKPLSCHGSWESRVSNKMARVTGLQILPVQPRQCSSFRQSPSIYRVIWASEPATTALDFSWILSNQIFPIKPPSGSFLLTGSCKTFWLFRVCFSFFSIEKNYKVWNHVAQEMMKLFLGDRIVYTIVFYDALLI